MSQFRISRAARLLGVSDDTVRRWLKTGHLPLDHDHIGRMVIDGAALATFAQTRARPPLDPSYLADHTDHNRLIGLITNTIAGTKTTQIEIQCGPYRVISQMNTGTTNKLDLTPGALAVVTVKTTHVTIETLN
jgi:excisionase family DNA binding protein